jgi:internalin A
VDRQTLGDHPLIGRIADQRPKPCAFKQGDRGDRRCQIGADQSADTAPQQAPDAAMAEKTEGMIEEMAPLAAPDAVEPCEDAGLVRLDITEAHIGDRSALRGVTGLEALAIDGSNITDLSPLSGMSYLRRLDITGVADVDISVLADLSLLSIEQ